MKVKRYVVQSMPDALHKIRSELGKDAVILNTKQVRSGGFLGLFRKKMIEVIAAADTAPPRPVMPNLAYQPSPLQSASSERTAAVKLPPLAEAEPQLKFRPKLQTQPKTADVKAEQLDLMEEIKQMKQMMLRLSTEQSEANWPGPLRSLEHRLRQHEIQPELIEQWLHSANEAVKQRSENSLTDEQAEQLVSSEMKKLFAGKAGAGINSQTRIVQFVGPTGVGKTTTIAKLAAEQVLKEKRKVGLIAADTYRIGAVEQLRTYANILNIPLEAVHSPYDMHKVLEQFADRDIIFVDTAGRNYRNELYVSELNSLLAGPESSETYLVLSLTAKYNDMKRITENFAKYKLDKVLFTKADETETFGPIFNLLHEYGLNISYIANGQNVPEHISLFNEDTWIKTILGEQPNA